MTTFAIVGGSGTIGRHIATVLKGAGHEVRVLGRSSREHPVDLTSGKGLEAALRGADVVIDASNGDQRRPEPVLVDGSRRLIAASGTAGVSHLVTVSIVGIERVPARYYRAKVAQEEVVRGGEVPWTIVQSTQFHDLVGSALGALARWRVGPRSSLLVQPVAAAEAGAAVAAVAVGASRQATVTVGGPAVLSLSDLARTWARFSKRALLPLRIPLPPSMGRPLRDGALICAEPDHRGSITFEQWLRTSS